MVMTPIRDMPIATTPVAITIVPVFKGMDVSDGLNCYRITRRRENSESISIAGGRGPGRDSGESVPRCRGGPDCSVSFRPVP